jgi:hypothetical protein
MKINFLNRRLTKVKHASNSCSSNQLKGMLNIDSTTTSLAKLKPVRELDVIKERECLAKLRPEYAPNDSRGELKSALRL